MLEPKVNEPTDDEILINTVLLEGMVAGLFESCKNIKPSTLGENMLEPFRPALSEMPLRDACEAVFKPAKKKTLPQELFFLEFIRSLQRGEGPFAELAAYLDEDPQVEVIKQLVRYLGVQFKTLFCLMAVMFKELAKDAGVLQQQGRHVQLSR